MTYNIKKKYYPSKIKLFSQIIEMASDIQSLWLGKKLNINTLARRQEKNCSKALLYSTKSLEKTRL